MSLPATNTRCLIALLAMLAFGLLPIATAQKRGLVYNDGININGFTAPGSKITWLYNWDSATTTPYPQHWNYVPMLWGLQQDHLTVWPGRAPGHANLLSFNEPERLEQSNLTPEQAADAYRTYMHPFGDSYLGSPAVSNDGYGWLERFLQVCGDCIIDFIAVHWCTYLSSPRLVDSPQADDIHTDDTADNVGDFTRWIDDVCRLSNGRPVVITEVRHPTAPPPPLPGPPSIIGEATADGWDAGSFKVTVPRTLKSIS